MIEYRLPTRDDLGFCNILICALGGDGANMAGKLLFKIGCSEFDLDGGYDAKYGSEKKGTPTDVSVRFCFGGTAVRQSGPTETPHFLVAFHADFTDVRGGVDAGLEGSFGRSAGRVTQGGVRSSKGCAAHGRFPPLLEFPQCNRTCKRCLL